MQFSFALDFDASVDVSTFDHYNNIIKAIRENLWYNPDTLTFLTQSEFKKQMKLDNIFQYSTNNSHPVFGQVTAYFRNLGPNLVEISNKIGEISEMLASMFQMLKSEKERNLELLILLPQLKSSTIRAFCNANSYFNSIVYLKQTIWQKLWIKDYPDTLIPNVLNLSDLWLELRNRTKSKIFDLKTNNVNINVLKGIMVKYADMYNLIHGDCFRLPSGDKWWIIQTDKGIDLISENNSESLSEMINFFTKTKGTNYLKS